MKIELILSRLHEYLKMLEVDKYQLEGICKLLEELSKDTEKFVNSQLPKTEDIILNETQISNICRKLGTISAAIKHLSPRRGSLMSRNSHIPWKLFMMMDATIHNKSIPGVTLSSTITAMIKNNEILKLYNQFKSFQKETKEKTESCKDYEIFLNKQMQLLNQLYELEKELTSKLNIFQQAHNLIRSIHHFLQEQKSNVKNVQTRLDELSKLKNMVKDNPFLTNIINRWENEIGFDVKNILDKKLLISSFEKTIFVQLKYYQDIHNTIADTIENIKNIRTGKDDQINLSQLRTTITKMINELTNSTTDADLNNVKVVSYKLFLKCLVFNINDDNIQNKLLNLQNVTITNKEQYLQLLKDTQESINPFQEHKHVLDDIKNSLTDKSKGFPYKIEAITGDKDTSKDQKIYKILHSNLKRLLLIKNQKAKSTLSPHIESLIKILIDEIRIDPLIDTSSISDKIVAGTTDRTIKQIDNLKAVYAAIENEKNEENLDTTVLFEKIQKYTTNLLQEEKSENDLEADLNFCPSLCRFLQYNFDIKNLKTILDTSNQLIEMFNNEDALNNPLQRITFLYSLLILGESTKDFSYEMKILYKDIPWFLIKSIRNKIFHILFDEKEGRDTFWQFLVGTSNILSKQLLTDCMNDIKNLYNIFTKMQTSLEPNVPWNMYPTYKGLVKPKTKTSISLFGSIIRSIIYESVEQEPSQEFADDEKKQQHRFPKLGHLSQALSAIDTQSRKTTALTKPIPEQEVEITNTLEEITAVENFFHNMIINSSSLKITYHTASVETTLSETQLTPVCHIGIAFCGGLLKLLKDYSSVFEATATPLLLLNAENIIYLRGELAHAVAVKDSKVELNTLLSINETIVPLLRLTACHLQLSQLAPVLNIEDELAVLNTKYKNLESTKKYNTLKNSANVLATNRNRFKEKEMKSLCDTYNAIRFYDEYDFSDKTALIIEINQLQIKCEQQYELLLKQLSKIKNTHHELLKYKQSTNSDLAVIIQKELSIIDQQVQTLEKSINQQRSTKTALQANITKLITEINTKMVKPQNIAEIDNAISQSYNTEYLFISRIEFLLKNATTHRDSQKNNIKNFDENYKLLEQTIAKRLSHLGNDPIAILNEIKKIPGINSENEKRFLDNLNTRIEESLQQYNSIFKQYKAICSVYEKSISAISLMTIEIENLKKQKTFQGEIANLYEQEIKKEKGILTNKLISMAKGMDILAMNLDQIIFLKQSLQVKAYSEPKDTKKYTQNSGPDISIASTLKHRFFQNENVLIPPVSSNNQHQRSVLSEIPNINMPAIVKNNSLNNTSLQPLVDSNLLDKNLIQYGLLSQEEIKKLSNPEILKALLSNEISIHAARKLSDVQINRFSSATATKRSDVLREILEEIYNSKPVMQKSTVAPKIH